MSVPNAYPVLLTVDAPFCTVLLAIEYVTKIAAKSSLGLNGLFKSSISFPLKLNLNMSVNILSADSIKFKNINDMTNPIKFSVEISSTVLTNTV